MHGIHDERPEQEGAPLPADVDRGEADTAHQPIVEPGGQGERRHRGHAFADAIGRAPEAAGSKGLRR